MAAPAIDLMDTEMGEVIDLTGSQSATEYTSPSVESPGLLTIRVTWNSSNPSDCPSYETTSVPLCIMSLAEGLGFKLENTVAKLTVERDLSLRWSLATLDKVAEVLVTTSTPSVIKSMKASMNWVLPLPTLESGASTDERSPDTDSCASDEFMEAGGTSHASTSTWENLEAGSHEQFNPPPSLTKTKTVRFTGNQ